MLLTCLLDYISIYIALVRRLTQHWQTGVLLAIEVMAYGEIRGSLFLAQLYGLLFTSFRLDGHLLDRRSAGAAWRMLIPLLSPFNEILPAMPTNFPSAGRSPIA